MAVESVTARLLALADIAIGVLLICFGIADRVVEFYNSWTGYGYFGIWIGVWMCVTGVLGIPGTEKYLTRTINVFNGAFICFSITSAVFGVIIIICYGLSIATCRDTKVNYLIRDYIDYEDIRNYDTKMAISVIILLLGIAEFGIGIWAAVLCCLMFHGYACCVAAPQHQPQQAVYPTNPAGYMMSQGPGTVPVAFPLQASAQEHQCPMVLVPVSGTVGGHPEVSTTEVLRTTEYSPQQQQTQEQYIPQKEQV